MSESSLVLLRDFLVQSYGDLKRRLTAQLGSADLADEALQDTWLRLRSSETPTPVSYPLSYLMRVALNVARDRIRSEGRFLRGDEVEELFTSLSDPMPTPAQAFEERAEVERLTAIIHELPPRRRRILILVRVDQLPRQEVADRLGVSLSLVDRELRRAHEHCAKRMRECPDRAGDASRSDDGDCAGSARPDRLTIEGATEAARDARTKSSS